MAPPREPFAARLHVVPRALRGAHAVLIATLRGYFSRAPGWVLLTTRGRRTGLPREVLLPCARTNSDIIVISTYGTRSDWFRNLRKDPRVEVTARGRRVPGHAEIVDDVFHKRAIVSANPFFPAAPFGPLNALARTVLRPPTVAALRRWVTPRPVVVIRLVPARP